MRESREELTEKGMKEATNNKGGKPGKSGEKKQLESLGTAGMDPIIIVSSASVFSFRICLVLLRILTYLGLFILYSILAIIFFCLCLATDIISSFFRSLSISFFFPFLNSLCCSHRTSLICTSSCQCDL